MVYFVNGQAVDGQQRSPWRLSFITDVFWGITDFIVMFFQSMIHPDITRRGYSSSISRTRYNDGRGPPARRMGRINHDLGPSPPPMAGGG